MKLRDTFIQLQHATTKIPYLLRAQAFYTELIKTLDIGELEALKKKTRSLPRRPTDKYILRYPYYLKKSLWRSLMLGLDASPQQLRILDIGSGSGYFLLVNRFLGHEVLGLDLAEANPLFAELFSLFRLSRIEHRVEALTPLPPMPQPFDLISATSITFTRHWDLPEWEFFVKDLGSRVAPGGRIFLAPNLSELFGIHQRPALKELLCNVPGFETRILNRRAVLLTAVDPEHDSPKNTH